VHDTVCVLQVKTLAGEIRGEECVYPGGGRWARHASGPGGKHGEGFFESEPTGSDPGPPTRSDSYTSPSQHLGEVERGGDRGGKHNRLPRSAGSKEVGELSTLGVSYGRCGALVEETGEPHALRTQLRGVQGHTHRRLKEAVEFELQITVGVEEPPRL
jgi:hypothetical protein